MGISVSLVSKDETLLKSCREILAELFATEWTLSLGVAGSETHPDDLCVWDFTPGETRFPQELDPANLYKHCFLVYRNDLTELQSLVGTTDLNVLLKPVTRTALRAFFRRSNPRVHELTELSDGLLEAMRGERDDMLQVLIQANLKLQENDQHRNNFLARSVHDFRAPLTAITGYCGLLLEEEFGPLTPEQSRVLGRMLHSATRLSRISNAMFQLSVPQRVEHTLNLERADIRDCLDQAIHETALVLEDKRISIASEVEPAPEGLLFDRSQIEQALVNLLDNASKFTPREGVIEIKGYPFFWDRRTGQSAPVERNTDRRMDHFEVFNSYRIDIRDSGPGIPFTHVSKIFEESASYGGGNDRSGGGLGLAISRMIVHRHQGRIWAESDSTGAVFSFVVPLQHAVARLSRVESLSASAGDAGKKDN